MSIEKIKKHVRKNKKIYLAAGVGFVVGAGVVLIVRAGGPKMVMDSWKITIISWKSPTTNIMQTVLERRGHPGYVVKCLETGKKFASQNEAAKDMSLNAARLSEHLNGARNQVNGFHFERLGEAIA